MCLGMKKYREILSNRSEPSVFQLLRRGPEDAQPLDTGDREIKVGPAQEEAEDKPADATAAAAS